MINTLTASGRHRVVIYGTLKRGEPNHPELGFAQFLGSDTLTSIVLYDLGPWPGARIEPSHGVEVEVYAVSLSQLAKLDEFEDYRPHAKGASLYVRRVVRTSYGGAWVYLYNGGTQTGRRIIQGTWSSHASAVNSR